MWNYGDDKIMDVINTFLTYIFGGGPESIIAILLMIIAGMGWFIHSNVKERKRLLDEQKDLTQKYNNKLLDVIEKSHATQSLTTGAINEIRVVLAEIKAKQ